MTTKSSFPVKYDSIPRCPEYHPLSELLGQAGYYPNISIDQLHAVNELVAMIQEAKLHFPPPSIGDEEQSHSYSYSYSDSDKDEFLTLLRFLRARKFNVKNAFKMLESDVHWRSEENRSELSRESVQDVLQCNIAEFYHYFPAWMQGYDKYVY